MPQLAPNDACGSRRSRYRRDPSSLGPLVEHPLVLSDIAARTRTGASGSKQESLIRPRRR
jgi:hypothetical protein